MGFKQQSLSKKSYQKKSFKQNLQSYYSNLYDALKKQLSKSSQCQQIQIDRALSSIFSRTKIPTKIPNDNQLLKILDVDKIISLNQRSLKQNGQEIKHMRMIASLKHQNRVLRQTLNGNGTQQRENSVRQIDNLVRMARLHFMRTNRPQGEEDSSEQEQTVRQ